MTRKTDPSNLPVREAQELRRKQLEQQQRDAAKARARDDAKQQQLADRQRQADREARQAQLLASEAERWYHNRREFTRWTAHAVGLGVIGGGFVLLVFHWLAEFMVYAAAASAP